MTQIKPIEDKLVIHDTSEGDNGAATIEQVFTAAMGVTGAILTKTTNANGKVILGTNTASLVSPTRQIIAGGGLTGGGDLSADRTLSVDLTTLPAGSGVDTGNDRVPYVDSLGATRLTSISEITGGLVDARPIGTI